MEVFTSKIDTWLLIVFVATILISTFAAFFSFKKGGVLNYIAAVFVLFIGAVLPIWLLLSTTYSINNEVLVVRSGPFSWSIPTASKLSVRDTRNSKSSPALSLDRLQINYDEGKSIMVSPNNKAKFKEAIRH